MRAALTIILIFLCAASCRVNQPKATSSALSTPMTKEERELLSYCKQVRSISERQKKTEEKIEEILRIVESQRDSKQPIYIDSEQREKLKQSWLEIEVQRSEAMRGYIEDTYPDKYIREEGMLEVEVGTDTGLPFR